MTGFLREAPESANFTPTKLTLAEIQRVRITPHLNIVPTELPVASSPADLEMQRGTPHPVGFPARQSFPPKNTKIPRATSILAEPSLHGRRFAQPPRIGATASSNYTVGIIMRRVTEPLWPRCSPVILIRRFPPAESIAEAAMYSGLAGINSAGGRNRGSSCRMHNARMLSQPADPRQVAGGFA